MEHILNLFLSGGYMMYPLILSAFIALIIILERFMTLKQSKVLPPELLSIIKKMTTKNDLNHADRLSKSKVGIFSNIVQLIFEHRSATKSEIEQIIETQGQLEIRFLEKGLSMLETIAGIAPLMGLLGTVFGIIKVFDNIKEVGLKDPGVFSGGISEALITTAVGLFIGISLLVFYNILSKKVENIVAQIQYHTGELILKMKQIEP